MKRKVRERLVKSLGEKALQDLAKRVDMLELEIALIMDALKRVRKGLIAG